MLVENLVNIVIPAVHFAETVRFYRDVLGLPLYHQGEHSCHLKLGDIFLAIYPTSARDPLGPTGRSIYLDFAVSDRDEAVEQLTAAGVAVERQWENHVGRFAQVADPEGNWIELIEYER